MRGFGFATLLLASTANAFVLPPPGAPGSSQDVDTYEKDVEAPETQIDDKQPFELDWALPKSIADVEIDISQTIARDDVDSALLQFNLEVKDSEKICGEGNFFVNGDKLGQDLKDDKYVGEGSINVDGRDVAAAWTFECVKGIDDRPLFRFLTFNINSIDNNDVSDQSLGFVAQFQQQSERTTIMFAEADLYMQAPDYKLGLQEEQEQSIDDVLDELRFLRHQMRELEWQIQEKEEMVREMTNGEFAPELSSCDSLSCVTDVLLHKVKGVAHHVAEKVTGHHGPPPPPGKKHGPCGNHTKHGNHTFPHHPDGNHSKPHPPHHGPPHRRPHHHLPICRFPPPPPHHGGPPGPPHGPPHGPPPPPPPPHGPPPHGKHGEGSPPPSPHSPPSKPHGDHPPPPHHDDDHRGPPKHDGPPGGDRDHHDGPPPPPHGPERDGPPPHDMFSNEHDHFDGPPPPPPFGPMLVLRFVVAGALLAGLASFIARRCCCARKSKKEQKHRRRQERREQRLRRKAARKQAWREWAMGLVRQMGVAVPMSDEEVADYEEKRAMLMEEAHFHAESEVGQEISQFRRAASVFGEVVDGERVGRASFETALPDYRSEAGDSPLPSYDDAAEEVDSLVSDGYRPGGHQYTPSNSSDAGSVRSILGDAKD